MILSPFLITVLTVLKRWMTSTGQRGHSQHAVYVVDIKDRRSGTVDNKRKSNPSALFSH